MRAAQRAQADRARAGQLAVLDRKGIAQVGRVRHVVLHLHVRDRRLHLDLVMVDVAERDELELAAADRVHLLVHVLAGALGDLEVLLEVLDRLLRDRKVDGEELGPVAEVKR